MENNIKDMLLGLNMMLKSTEKLTDELPEEDKIKMTKLMNENKADLKRQLAKLSKLKSKF